MRGNDLAMLSLSDFQDDKPWTDDDVPLTDIDIPDQIEGVRIQRLVTHADPRGDLTVLLSTQYGSFDPLPPQVYWVRAAPGSIRAWVYHRRQSDRLALTNGTIRVVLIDLRKDGATYGKMNILDVGTKNPVLLTIPPLVVHGVENRGKEVAAFINMPTQAYNPANPDKARLRFDHPDIPYRFE